MFKLLTKDLGNSLLLHPNQEVDDDFERNVEKKTLTTIQQIFLYEKLFCKNV